jgi:hypothetical protein
MSKRATATDDYRESPEKGPMEVISRAGPDAEQAIQLQQALNTVGIETRPD